MRQHVPHLDCRAASIKALADQPNDQSTQVVPRHAVLHARWQKLNFVNLPGAKLLAHHPTQNQTSRRIQSSILRQAPSLARSREHLGDRCLRVRTTGRAEHDEGEPERTADVAKSVDAADFNWSARGETRGAEPLKVGES